MRSAVTSKVLKLVPSMFWLFSTLATADNAPVKPCELIEVLKQSGKTSAEINREIHGKLKSCADFALKACALPDRLDQNSVASSDSKSCADCRTPSLAPQAGSTARLVAHIAQQTENPARTSVLKQLTQSYQRYEELRHAEAKSILDIFQAEGFSPSLTLDEAKSAVTQFATHVNELTKNLPAGEQKSWSNYVAKNFEEAASDALISHATQDIEPGMITALKEQASDSVRFSLLATRINEVDTGEDFYGDVTPYHAKIFLLTTLETRLKAKYPADIAKQKLDALANSLVFKSAFGGKTTWDSIIPHNGFALGAPEREIRQFAQLTHSPNRSTYSPAAVDCATFVQSELKAIGYSVPGRLSSYRIVSQNALGNISTRTKINENNTLNIRGGDLITKREDGDPVGHVQAVLGYEGDPPDLVVISAEGGFHRGLIRRRIPIYSDFPYDCTTGNCFTEFEGVNYQRIEITRPAP